MRIWWFLQYEGCMHTHEENTACSEWKYTFQRNSEGNQEGKSARGRGVGPLLLLSIYSHVGVQRSVFDRFNHIPFLPNSCRRHHDINQLLFFSCLERSCELCLQSDLNRIWGGKDGKGDHDLRFMCIDCVPEMVSTVPMTCWRSIWISWTTSTNINWDVLRVAGKVAIGGHMFNTVSFNPHIKRVWFVF